MTKKKRLAILGVATILAIVGCTPAADRASENISTASDNFEIQRRIVFFNGITDTYLLEIQGLCSINADVGAGGDDQVEVTCKVGDNKFKKHYLGLSDNVSYFVEQTDAAKADEYRYRVVFRPETVLPAPELRTSGG